MNSSFSNYGFGQYDPTNFSNQFIQNALNPQPAPVQQTPYQTWPPVIQQAYNAASAPVNTNAPVQQTNNTSKAAQDWATYHPNEGPKPEGYNGENGGSNPLADYQNQQLSSINQGYDQYFAQLDSMISSDLPQQRSSQEGIISNSYNQGVNDLNFQQAQSLSDLNLTRTQAEQTQNKSLRNLAEDVRNSMQAGNVYLGARGAGDSSASRMYAYALGKAANKNKSDLLANYQNIKNEISSREFKIKSTVNNEMNRLRTEKENNILSVANWYSQAVMGIRQAQAQGQLGRQSDIRAVSQQALNYAMTQLQQAQSQYQNQQNMLNTWAANNATSLGQLKTNLQAVGQYMPQMQNQGFNPSVSFGGSSGSSAGNNQYYSSNSSSTEKRDIFGNIIRF